MNTKDTILRIIYSLVTIISSVVLFAEIILGRPSLVIITQLIVLFLVIVYYLYIYKVPHSNMLKYLVLTFAFSLVFSLNESIQFEVPTDVAVTCIIMILIGYFAGRLNKIKKNKYLIVIVSVLFLHLLVSPVIKSDAEILPRLGNLVIWLDISAAYLFCFNQHIQAGIEADSQEEIK